MIQLPLLIAIAAGAALLLKADDKPTPPTTPTTTPPPAPPKPAKADQPAAWLACRRHVFPPDAKAGTPCKLCGKPKVLLACHAKKRGPDRLPRQTKPAATPANPTPEETK
jgi:hypothetical protein